MKITWLGHAGYRIEVEKAVLLLDPWIIDAPFFPAERVDEALAGATHVLLTHGHGDHSANIATICKSLGVPVVGIYDLVGYLGKTHGIDIVGFNRGGTVNLGGAKVTLVAASHSSTLPGAEAPIAAGSECGFMIAGDGHVIYASGDTDIMADMAWMGEYHQPDIGILSCGGHFTMDMARAAWAAKRYFNFKTVIPSHFRTMPILEQNVAPLRDALPGVNVIDPVIMAGIEL